jgi:large subunit ribosomal protein L15
MEILKELNKVVDKQQKRLGRGIGSGVGGHTVGRGAKGQKARRSVKLTADGTKTKKGWIQRLPFLRGKRRTNKRSINTIFNLNHLEKLFKSGDTVDIKTLSEKSKRVLTSNTKILSQGKLTKSLKVKGILVSEAGKNKIISAGGNIE